MTQPAYRRVTSFTRSVLSRTPQIKVFCPEDLDGLTLSQQLKRIGCTVELRWPPPQEIDGQIDLIFLFIAPEAEETSYPWLQQDHPPIVSVINFENPAVVDEALRIGAMGMLVSPVHALGVLSTVMMALQHARHYEKTEERIRRLENKATSARTIEEAKKILIAMHGASESDAYEMLRTQAMNLRLQIEDVASQVIQANKILFNAIPAGLKKSVSSE
ncbi:ANTAR domain-containing response regulator [Noviherbaspirillum suwonense]|uniref:Two-component response regulator, AmiR/NasT family, consists of REC and RNA-binding antiterminator (ANTAR) domains n=1 Tax=Noviherbaspirillum suwonense TaxID=1224511 RepID=A0ABY1QUQ4_9BURK|nr:ANTAR domain-containing protein [Noviherbaspirillum suwonense]SMP80655.1 Two-component response regulator, AmiR/NasT family, consists of REC and RNA-binding antiterminator (ANTAR) domains [Noviherbaspirillum suwonense]